MDLLESGMLALHAHDYRRAVDHFTSLLQDHPDEPALGDRARVFLGICARELAKAPEAPATIEDRLNAATAALNSGDDERAEFLARQVAAEDDSRDLAHYLLAAVSARRGDTRNALFRLSEAIGLRPDLKAQARHDEDFRLLRDDDEFRHMTDLGTGQSHRSAGRPVDDR